MKERRTVKRKQKIIPSTPPHYKLFPTLIDLIKRGATLYEACNDLSLDPVQINKLCKRDQKANEQMELAIQHRYDNTYGQLHGLRDKD